jgi:hypothetical protein
MPNILKLMVRRGSHATAHYSMEYRHGIHGLDVCLGEGRMTGVAQKDCTTMRTPQLT